MRRVTADYALRKDGDVDVVNTCRPERLDGAGAPRGARPGRSSLRARLEVQFFWPLHGAYSILDLDPDYRWAVVDNPSREYLSISRARLRSTTRPTRASSTGCAPGIPPDTPRENPAAARQG